MKVNLFLALSDRQAYFCMVELLLQAIDSLVTEMVLLCLVNLVI